MRKRSSNFAKIRLFKMDFDKVMKALRNYAEKAVEKGAEAVILIGSLAKGDYTAFSDADVIIIMDNVPKNALDRVKKFIDPTLPVDVQPRVYTSKEIMEMAKSGRKITKEMVKYGKVLAGSDEVIENIRELLML